MTMTQRGAGSFGPRTLPGRIVAVLWMIGSIVVIAVFTAGITSVLTIKHLQGAVHGSGDLSAVRVGAVAGASTESTLSRMQIKYRKFSSPQDGLKAAAPFQDRHGTLRLVGNLPPLGACGGYFTRRLAPGSILVGRAGGTS
jgi:hypothetical protein